MIIAVKFQFKPLERRSLKKISASAGFEPVTSAIPVQCSNYGATRWERDQFIEFISPVRWNDMKCIYEIIYIWTAVVDESEEWSWRAFIYNRSSNMNYFIYILHIISLLTGEMNSRNWPHSFFTFIYNRSSNMNYFTYTSHQKKMLSYKPKESLQD